MEKTTPVKAIEFEKVFHSNYSKIYNYIYFKTGNHTDAEDLTADVFVKALKHYHRFDPEKCGVATWLRTIAHNTVVDYFRKRGRYYFENGPVLDGLASELDVESSYMQQETWTHLVSLIKELPAKHQELLAQKYFLGMTNREISKISGLSESNVGTILHRVIARLKAKL